MYSSFLLIIISALCSLFFQFLENLSEMSLVSYPCCLHKHLALSVAYCLLSGFQDCTLDRMMLFIFLLVFS